MKEDAETALKDLTKKPFQGRTLSLSLAKPKPKDEKKKQADGSEAAPEPAKQRNLKPKSKVRLATDPTKLYEPGAKEARVVLRNLEFSV